MQALAKTGVAGCSRIDSRQRNVPVPVPDGLTRSERAVLAEVARRGMQRINDFSPRACQGGTHQGLSIIA